ncbi:MAG: hypothetical protein A2146_01255 [Actinobacteria bacterium RBG_16_67_10]|nr:MAG: hypothetical protein A2146_01255 [Actinobacteria bacterium RBG_16_67_10]
MALSDHAQAELDTLLASLDLLADDDVWYLADLWTKEDDGARRQAWVKAKAAIEAAGLTGELDRVRGTVGTWMQASSSDFTGIEGLLGSSGSGAGGRRGAAPAFIDAAAAIIAGDALDELDQKVLLGPWRGLGEEEAEA